MVDQRMRFSATARSPTQHRVMARYTASRGDSYDNSLTESVNALYKKEFDYQGGRGMMYQR